MRQQNQLSKTSEAAQNFLIKVFFYFRFSGEHFVETVKEAVKDRQKRGKTPRKIRYNSYMQWALCSMVSTVSVVTDFYLL